MQLFWAQYNPAPINRLRSHNTYTRRCCINQNVQYFDAGMKYSYIAAATKPIEGRPKIIYIQIDWNRNWDCHLLFFNGIGNSLVNIFALMIIHIDII
jgi:hypothetical protein